MRGAETAKQLFYERLNWWLCARLVASGPHLKQALLTRAGVPETRVVVIPNAVDVARFASPPKERSATASPASGAAALLLGADASIPAINGRGTATRPEGRLDERAASGSPATALRRTLAPNGERVLVSVGRISRQKSMHLIPEALGILKRQGRLPANVRVCIVGQVEYPQMQARLEETVRREGLEQYDLSRDVDEMAPHDTSIAAFETACRRDGIPAAAVAAAIQHLSSWEHHAHALAA